MSAKENCPCCGGPAPGTEFQWLAQDGILVGQGTSIRMTLREAQIFNVLWQGRTERYALSMEEIAARAFSNDSGAPECELDCIRIYKFKIRQKIRAVGLQIKKVGTTALTHGPGCQGTYRLLRNDEPAKARNPIRTRPEPASVITSRRFNV